MRLRQVALVARDLDAVVEHLTSVLGIQVSLRDPEVKVFGLRNAVMPIGDTFLEVVSPLHEDASAARFLERRGGDGGYMVILQSDDLERDRERMQALGVRIVFQHALPDIATIHLHPRDVGGAILSLDVAMPPTSWRWAGPDWPERVAREVSRAIGGVELQTHDPDGLASRWSRVLDWPAVESGGDGQEIRLDAGVIRFGRERDGRGEGLVAVEVEVADRDRVLRTARSRGLETSEDEVRICGVSLRLRPPS